MSIASAWERWLSSEVDARPLGIVRIVVSLAAFLKLLDVCVLAIDAASVPFRAPFFDWFGDWAWTGLPFALILWAVSAACLLMGVASRASAAALCGAGAWVMALDQRFYASHFYLLISVCFVLALVDSGTYAAVRWVRRPEGSRRVDGWPVTLLKLQLSLVYGFGALTKVNASFLSGDLLDQVTNWNLVPAILRLRPALVAVSVIVVVVEAFLAVGLWWSRTRPAANLLGLGLHGWILATIPHHSLQLTIFAMVTVSLYVLFLPVGDAPRVVVVDDTRLAWKRLGAWLRRLDWLATHRFVPATDREAVAALGVNAPAIVPGLWLDDGGAGSAGLRASTRVLALQPLAFLWADAAVAVLQLAGRDRASTAG